MKVVLARVDERLLHGQVIASWSRILEIKIILGVDDKIAIDPIMKQVLEMTSPTGVEAKVITCEEAFNELSSSSNNIKTMLLFKGVEAPLKLRKLGFALTELDIGNIGSGPTRKPITRRVFMSDDEVNIVKELQKLNVFVYLQMLSADPKIDFKDIKGE